LISFEYYDCIGLCLENIVSVTFLVLHKSWCCRCSSPMWPVQWDHWPRFDGRRPRPTHAGICCHVDNEVVMQNIVAHLRFVQFYTQY